MASQRIEQKEQKKITSQDIADNFQKYWGHREIDSMMIPIYELDKEYTKHRELLNQDLQSNFTRGFKARCFFALRNIKEWMGRSGNLAPKEIVRLDIPWLFKFWDCEEALLEKKQ